MGVGVPLAGGPSKLVRHFLAAQLRMMCGTVWSSAVGA
jgi:hypothetical protein